jgi:ArsR family transcriptional regulator
MTNGDCCRPPQKRSKRSELSEEEFANYCKALGHPARARLLRLLIDKGECISGDLADEFALAPSTVSEHLRILKEAGFVQGTIDGPRRSYCVNQSTLEQFKAIVDSI